MPCISLQSGVIKTPQNTRIGIRYKSKDGQTKEAQIVAGDTKHHYIAQFEEDNVDFVIWIDCINDAERRKFNYKLTVGDRTYSYMVDNGKYRELKALVSKGCHLHFVSKSIVKLNVNETPEKCIDYMGNLKFDLCYSTFIKVSIDALNLNLSHSIRMTISMPYNAKVANIKKEIASKLSQALHNHQMELYAGCGNILMDDAAPLDKYSGCVCVLCTGLY